jgi:hypothetical protein
MKGSGLGVGCCGVSVFRQNDFLTLGSENREGAEVREL